MAVKLYITTQAGYTYQNYNLLTGTLKLVEGSRRSVVSGDRVLEMMQLTSVSGATDISIIQAENKLNELGHMARDYIEDSLQQYPIWFQENATSETMRQSLIYDIQVQQIEDANTSRLLGRQGVAIWNLVVERAIWWEPVTVISHTEASGVASCGGNTGTTTIIPAVNSGVVPGRIPAMIVVPSAGTMTELWVGIRKVREYQHSQIYSRFVWRLKAGTNGTDTATANEGTNAYSGTTSNIKECTFATTETMATRVTLSYANAVGDFSANTYTPTGKYLVLLRAKVGSSTSCRVRLSSGYASSFRVHNEVEMSNTSYKLIPLGEVNFPASGYRAASSAYSMDAYSKNTYNLLLAAERLSGSGSLYLDSYVLIPTDAFFHSVTTDLTAASGYRVVVYTFPDGKTLGIVANSSLEMFSRGDFDMQNWEMPYMGPYEQSTMATIIVFAFQSSTVQTITDALGYQVTYLPRYKAFSRYAA